MWRTLLLLVIVAFLYDGGTANAQQLTLPPLTLSPSESGALSSGARVFVREFRFQGNTIFSSMELATLTAPYVNRELTSEQLEEVRRLLTAFYVEFGYVNSGAILPDQDVRDGIVTFQIVEGVLSDIKIRGKDRRLRDSYITTRLRRWAGPPLRINELKEGLLLLRQDPNVKQINAELRPGTKPGESYLDVYLQEEQPFHLGLQVDNHRPPSVGAEEILLIGADQNLTGNGDLVEFTYGIAHNGEDGFEFSGAEDESGSYTLPIHPSGTTIRVFGSRNDTSIIEEPFAVLGITNTLIRYGVTLRQPVYRTANREVALGVTFERDHNEAFFLGQPAGDDVVPGSVNGRINTSVLRFTQEWLDRSQIQVLALRSTFNVGIDAFGVTDNGTDRNAKFFSWLGQLQYVRRLFDTQNLIILRTDGQWTDEPLLPTEQFSVGGANSVRGYRENQIVRDCGFVSSVEGRVPILFGRGGVPVVQLAPFFDCGGAWTLESKTPSPETIYSSGIGILVTPNKHLNAQLYWGHRFTHVPNPHNNAQDLGIDFKVTFLAF
ncbi:MAG TPA: ShlB/FhaC/HecB family hemolysin secretion/activation protein [Verrucomicrobiae bacterium]|nr:ShlB/FhaC/HecB family hemolysin secretion/activation protein [Verrucomicrobiae bacterium]